MTGSPRILYVAGMGRSGSTVLDAVLGSHPAARSVGELGNAYRAWHSDDEYCACGVLGRACPFWLAVRESWRARLAERGLTEQAWETLRLQHERLRAAPRLLLGAPGGAAFRAYGYGLVALYGAVADVSGRSVVVDSTKNPVRGLVLTHQPGLDVRVIHLVRDGRGVAWSLMKSFRKDPQAGVQHDLAARPIWRTAASWRLKNVLAERACRSLGSERSLRLCYEDFTADPATALARIGALAGLDYGAVAERLLAGAPLGSGHAIAGNRVRMRGIAGLRTDRDWVRRLDRRQQAVFWWIAGPLARRYGYPRRAPS